jgi:hypothetical protein
MRQFGWLAAAALISVAFLPSCYKSAPGTGRDADADAASDPVVDQASDRGDAVPDPPMDVYVEPDAPPFTGIDLVISNLSSPATGMTFYYTVWGWDADTYPFTMERITYGEPEPVNMNRPWCSLACDEISGGDDCCILCEDVIDAVRVLAPGQRVRHHWDGILWAMDYDRCDCGCHYPYAAQTGRYEVSLCAGTSIRCYDAGFCEPDDNGVIWGAYLDPEYESCSMNILSMPEDSGETIEFVYMAENY